MVQFWQSRGLCKALEEIYLLIATINKCDLSKSRKGRIYFLLAFKTRFTVLLISAGNFQDLWIIAINRKKYLKNDGIKFSTVFSSEVWVRRPQHPVSRAAEVSYPLVASDHPDYYIRDAVLRLKQKYIKFQKCFFMFIKFTPKSVFDQIS